MRSAGASTAAFLKRARNFACSAIPRNGSRAISTSDSRECPPINSSAAQRRTLPYRPGRRAPRRPSEPSRVLLALGLDQDTAATSVRISLGRFTTEAEIDQAVEALSRIPQTTERR